MAKGKPTIKMPAGGVRTKSGTIVYKFGAGDQPPAKAKKKAPRKDSWQTALSIVEQVTGGKLKR